MSSEDFCLSNLCQFVESFLTLQIIFFGSFPIMANQLQEIGVIAAGGWVGGTLAGFLITFLSLVVFSCKSVHSCVGWRKKERKTETIKEEEIKSVFIFHPKNTTTTTAAAISFPYLFFSTCSHAGTGCANGWGRLRSLWQTNNPPVPCCPAL